MACFVGIAEGHNTFYDHVPGDSEDIAHDVFRRLAVGGKASAYLHPAGAYAESGSLKVHQYRSRRGVFDISLAFFRVCGHYYGHSGVFYRCCVIGLAFRQACEHFRFFHHHELPGAGIFR